MENVFLVPLLSQFLKWSLFPSGYPIVSLPHDLREQSQSSLYRIRGRKHWTAECWVLGYRDEVV